LLSRLSRRKLKKLKIFSVFVNDVTQAVRGKRRGFNIVADIVAVTEEDLSHVRNLGRKSRKEVVGVIEMLGLSLKEQENAEAGEADVK
jgi:DNA-directed RNA polymerase alpha subunit